MKIKTKLLLASLSVALYMTVTAILGGLYAIEGERLSVLRDELLEFEHKEKELRNNISNILSSDNLEYLKTSKQQYEQKNQKTIEILDRITENYPEKNNLINDLHQSHNDFVSLGLEIINKHIERTENNQQNSLGDLVNKFIHLHQSADESLHKLVEQINTENKQLSENSYPFLTLVIVGAWILAIILAMYFSKTITRPIQKLMNHTSYIADGNFDKKIESIGNDEIHDLTDKVNNMTEKLQNAQNEILRSERLSSIGQLSARLAHDLRNPLTVIKADLELLKQENTEISSKSKERFTRIENAVERMTYQIEDVMGFVRTRPLEITNSSIIGIIQSALLSIKTKNINVIFPQDDLLCDCDPKQIETVFINIITNAVQSMGDNGEIKVRFYDKNKHVTIEIEDSGSGIDEDDLPHIFEPLFTTKLQGTGLGLASCKTIVEQHGGTITVKNRPTTFTITLPKK